MSGLPDVLARICAAKQAEVAERSAATPLAEIERQALAAPPPPALRGRPGRARGGRAHRPDRRDQARLSLGRADPRSLRSGRPCPCLCGGRGRLPVGADRPAFFQGGPEDLKAARAACDLPVLRKDFLLDPWQVFESRAMGADAVLLIMACLSDDQARELEAIARGLDMAVLAEVHNRAELDRALGLQTRLIGVNNRDLRTLVTDLATAEALVPLIPPDRLPVAESGLRGPEDVRRMAAAGARCLLVGEHLLRQPDVAAAARSFVEAA